MRNERSFTEIVQVHERKWGEFQYPGRPSLDTLLKCPVVAVWRVDKRFILSTHLQITDLNELVLAIVLGNDPYNRKLLMIFENQKAIDFKTVVQFVPATPDKKPYTSRCEPLKRQPQVVALNRQPDLVPFKRGNSR